MDVVQNGQGALLLLRTAGSPSEGPEEAASFLLCLSAHAHVQASLASCASQMGPAATLWTEEAKLA